MNSLARAAVRCGEVLVLAALVVGLVPFALAWLALAGLVAIALASIWIAKPLMRKSSRPPPMSDISGNRCVNRTY